MSSATVNVTAKWQSTVITFPFPLSSTVADLHTHIALLLHLSPTLKLVGLTKGRLPPPTTPLSDLQLPADVKVLVVGVRAEDASEVAAMDAAFSARKAAEDAREEQRQRQLEMRQRMEDDIRREQERVAEERRKAYEAERAERERKWQEEQARREQERREEELRAEQAGGNVTLMLSALLSPEADSKQKLILPPAALQSIVDAKVAFPLTFAVRKTGGAQREEEEEEKKQDKDSHAAEVVHLGVADFNSPHSSVVLVPSSLLSSLQCSEGQSLTLSTVTLPKATHITLVPLPSTSPTGSLLPSTFLALSPPERTALLEFHLRSYQHLQRNQLLSLHYRRHQPAMRFEVKDTQPADVVSIIDADVQAEVEAADVGEVGGEEGKGGEPQYVPVMVGEVVEGELAKGEYWRGRVRLDDANGRYEVSVHSVKGDADVYVARWERTNAEVDTTYWDWRGVEVGDDRIVLSSEEARWQPGEFDIAVHAYEADCAFKLTVNLLPPATSAASSSTSSAPTSSSSSTASAATAADTKICPNCHKPIPARSLAMHELQCRRNNSTCPDCHAVVLTRNLPKHRHTTHTPATCPACQLSLPPPALAQHRREACMGRLVECLYCPMLVTAEERGEHSSVDGLFRSACKECGEVMQRKLIRRHMRLVHAKNERHITWRDFF